MTSGRRGEKSTAQQTEKLQVLQRFALFFFDRPRLTSLVAVAAIVFGLLSYTTLLTREGFPSINVPYAIVNGTYIVNDAAKVDASVAKPVSELILKQPGVKSVQAQSAANFFSIAVQYNEGVDAQARIKELQTTVTKEAHLPDATVITYNVPYFGVTGGDTKRLDATISFYRPQNDQSTEQLTASATTAVQYLNAHKPALVDTFFVETPYQSARNPLTNQTNVVQKNFDRYGSRVGGVNNFHDSVIIGVTAKNGADVIELDAQLRTVLTSLQQQRTMRGYSTAISASYAPAIQQEISELQRVLFEGLLAVLVVGSLVIAVRAAFITVISMVSVITITAGVLYLFGYSLNVITLFALILGLSLIVDDTIIMVEALDVSRKRNTDRRSAVRQATGKISRAMVAATTTAALSFAPLLFVSGILGSFIRAVPVTIISALIISLILALVVIPLLARYLMLGKKQMGEHGVVKEYAAGFEHRIAEFVARPMLWARPSRAKMSVVGSIAVLVGVGFVVAALFIGKDLVFNIFPPTKDTNGITLNLAFPPNTTIAQAQATADRVDAVAGQVIGSNFIQSSYYNSGTISKAAMRIDIVSYSKRRITSPEIVAQLTKRFQDFKDAQVSVGQVDVGPPASAFTVQIQSEDRQAAYRLANDVASYLRSVTLTRTSGKVAHTTAVSVSNESQYIRVSGKQTVQVTANFDGTDTSTLLTLAQTAVKKEFPANRVASYGLSPQALTFNLGQESDNQSSFKSLALAFPILLAIMYVLLAFQFRSLLQPLLIFMALPFSLFGIALGLRLSNNPISFFAMLGFFALIGLSIKNTILLTDYANQSRRAGMDAIDAAHAALAERFRPLVATSLTAVVSLIPLALTSPFWQGLAVVLIFGLLSSTFLVVTVFPYYYLGGEALRAVWRNQVTNHFRRTTATRG